MSHADTRHRDQDQRPDPGLEHPEAGEVILGQVEQEPVNQRDQGNRLDDFLGLRPERGALRIVAFGGPPEDWQHQQETDADEAACQFLGVQGAEIGAEKLNIDAEGDGTGDQLGEHQSPDIAHQQHEAVGERRQARACHLLLARRGLGRGRQGRGNGGGGLES